MRILFVHNEYLQNAGGEDLTVRAEMELLKSKGHHVEALYFNNQEFGKNGIRKIRAGIEAVYNRNSRKKLRAAIHSFKPDLVHAHNFNFSASPAIFFETHAQKIPVVATLHNYRLICVNALLLLDQKLCERCVNLVFPVHGLLHRCYHHSVLQSGIVGSISGVHKILGTWKNKIDLFITPSAFARKRLLRSSLDVRPEKMVVKRNFIADPGLGEFSSREDHFLFVGRLSAEKGVDVLIDCFKELPGEQLTIVGEGPDGGRLRQKAAGLPNITFIGQQDQQSVLSLMKRCKALLFPSVWYEGLPITIIEALATGTPVIASRLGAMEEMISHEKSGYLFEPGNFMELRQILINFSRSPAAGIESCYNEARKTYVELYSPEVCYQSIMEIYKTVLKQAGGKAKEIPDGNIC